MCFPPSPGSPQGQSKKKETTHRLNKGNYFCSRKVLSGPVLHLPMKDPILLSVFIIGLHGASPPSWVSLSLAVKWKQGNMLLFSNGPQQVKAYLAIFISLSMRDINVLSWFSFFLFSLKKKGEGEREHVAKLSAQSKDFKDPLLARTTWLGQRKGKGAEKQREKGLPGIHPWLIRTTPKDHLMLMIQRWDLMVHALKHYHRSRCECDPFTHGVKKAWAIKTKVLTDMHANVSGTIAGAWITWEVLGRCLRACCPNRLPGDANAAGVKPTL